MFARSRLFFSVKNDTMFEADKITEKNKKQRFYEKGIYSKIFHRRFLAFALFAYGFFGFAGDFVGAKSSVSAYGENAGDVTIEKLGHEPGEWIVDREPTAEETGHRYKECIRCNEVIEEEILEKLPPEDNGMDKGEGDKDDGTDDGKTMTAVRMTAAAAGITVMLGMSGENRNRRRITIKANPKAEKTMCRRRLRFCCR